MNDIDRELVEEQIRYYGRRATEYDETSAPPEDPLAPQAQQLWTALDRFEPREKVLELACGTGSRTKLLLKHAREIVALDSSDEMIELARRKVGDRRVRFIHEDVFSWTPDDRYDVVCFFFWLSHVLPTRFEEFWDLVRRCLAPSGRVFFADEGPHDFWKEEFVEEANQPIVRRKLRDGSSYRVVKVFWEPNRLENRLTSMGWQISVHSTGAFYWGEGSPDTSTKTLRTSNR